MPTIKPRVNVTLKPEDFALLSTLAKQQKRSRSDLLRDLFETIRPVLERVAVVTEAALRARATAKEGLVQSAEKAEAELRPLVAQALGQFDLFLEDVKAGAEAPPQAAPAPPQTPVPVITGVRYGKSVDNLTRTPPKPAKRKPASRAGRKVKAGARRARK